MSKWVSDAFIPSKNFSTGQFVSARTGLRVVTYKWMPSPASGGSASTKISPEIKAVVFWQHGLNVWGARPWAEHRIAENLNRQNIVFMSHDHASFGESDGEKDLRAYVTDFSVFTDDALQHAMQSFQQLVQERCVQKDTPFFVWGMSMGGMIAIDLGLRIQAIQYNAVLHTLLEAESAAAAKAQAEAKAWASNWRGVVLFCPAVMAVTLPAAPMVCALKCLFRCCGCCCGTKGIVPGMSDDFVKKIWHPSMFANGAAAAALKLKTTPSKRDGRPLGFDGPMKLSLAYALKHQQEMLTDGPAGGLLARTEFPSLCIIHGASDLNVDIRGSRLLFDRTRTADKLFIAVEGGYHDLMLDPKTTTALDAATSFLLKRLEPAPTNAAVALASSAAVLHIDAQGR